MKFNRKDITSFIAYISHFISILFLINEHEYGEQLFTRNNNNNSKFLRYKDHKITKKK
jgi:hypothetical protein